MKIRNIFSSQQPELPFPKPEDAAAKRAELVRTAEGQIAAAQAACTLVFLSKYAEKTFDQKIADGKMNYTHTLHTLRDSFAKVDMEALEKDQAYKNILEVCKRRNWFVEMKIVPAAGTRSGQEIVFYVDFMRGFSPKVQPVNGLGLS